ncbi:MAG: hypothetical protein BGO78_01240 [Chloroflexi bacterium 44-23]|nr:MAG: hypothetical protein BGO78_01240 [Chloroflexi bacterium 44-23]
MSKKTYFLLFLLALMVSSINFIFQKSAGYLDSQYYFLGGKALANGSSAAPVVWNYLDDPKVLPHPLFTYWMPLSSIIAALSMVLLQSQTFFAGRIFFWMLAAISAPLTAFIAMRFFNNRFTAIIAALLAIFNGLYFKFMTIPENISIYIVLGALFFYSAERWLFSSDGFTNTWRALLLGVLAGLLNLARVDGLIFIGLLLAVVLFKALLKQKDSIKPRIKIFEISIFIILGYLLVMTIIFMRNFELFGSIFSPASARTLWLTEYNDTFIFPADKLTFSYWLQTGLPYKLTQVWDALKLNFGNLLAVQLGLIGIPLFVLSIRSNWKSHKLLLPIIYFLIMYFIMTVFFSLAGGRGGYIHAMAAIQVYFWILIADGLSRFIQWGINRRGWRLKRSRIMFGSGLIVFAIILTFFFYYKDVISYGWNHEIGEFQSIENTINKFAVSKEKVIMINNPVGYQLETDRWAIVIPNSNWENLSKLIKRFDVRFIVLDDNLPDQIDDPNLWQENFQLSFLTKLPSGKVLYELP